MYEITDYKDLLLEYGSKEQIPYPALLLTDEWLEKKEEIEKRDERECQNCGTSQTYYKERSLQADGTYLYPSYRPQTTRKMIHGRLCHVLGRTNHRNHTQPIWLEVHHKFYIIGKLPWEYDDEALVTYCQICHGDWHENNPIVCYELDKDNKLQSTNYKSCPRCSGMGYIRKYRHVQGGVCFECMGVRFVK